MIGIIIPNLNGIEHLKICFDSLIKQTYSDFIILLVDNNSSDNSVEFTRKYYPGIEIIVNERNYGFAKAVNIGIKKFLDSANIDYILLLNNDIECDENFLMEMMKGFISDEVGSVACKMMNFYKRERIDTAGDFIKRRGSPYARGHNEIDKGQFDKSEFIFGACAGAALYKSEVFKKVGLFDEDFFAYYEDVDLDLRMHLMGYKCYYNPKAVCYHKRGSTTKSREGYQAMLCEKNLIALRIKNYPLPILVKFQIYFFAGRIRRYYRMLRYVSMKTFIMALRGYIWGMYESPKFLMKRKNIQSKKILNNKDFKKLFY